MAIGIVVQARMGSSRLPGKVLADLAGKPAIVRMLDRLKRVSGKLPIILATSVLAIDDPLVDVVRREACVAVWRGAETDVLRRYAEAARHFDLDPIVRVTGDCPLIEPAVITRVLDAFRQGAFDYADNLMPRTYPHGYDVQIVSRRALEIADKEAEAPAEREHVLPFVNSQPGRFAATHVVSEDSPCTDIRITLDYPEDLTLIRGIYEALYPANPDFGLKEILDLRAKQPELFAVNAGRRQF
jgi:spore coat polysaccharide biosynthesis protein SpsF